MDQTIKPTALVVEDDEDQRFLVSTLLEESDMRVVECESAEAAAVAMECMDGSFALLFADVNLSGDMTGVELAAMVKQRFPDVSIVVTSGNGQPTLPSDAVFLQKPWRSLDILREAEKALHP